MTGEARTATVPDDTVPDDTVPDDTVPDDRTGLSAEQRRAFCQQGYVRAGTLLTRDELAGVRAAFDDAWAAGEKLAQEARCWILSVDPFRAVLRSPRLGNLLRSVFGGQAQLLDCYPIYQPPAGQRDGSPQGSTAPRDWHRDFTFVREPDGFPLMITILTFLDDVHDEVGPTLVLPGTHRVRRQVIPRHDATPRPEELALPVRAGEGLLLDSAIIHSPGRNESASPRRGLVMNFGYWWMKPWDMHLPLPPEATRDITPDLECLLGLRCPADDLYLFAAI